MSRVIVNRSLITDVSNGTTPSIILETSRDPSPFPPRQPNRSIKASVSALALAVLGLTAGAAAAQDAGSDGSIGTVKIQGDAPRNTMGPNVGANGSSDVGATEGTGSLTTDSTTISSKSPLSILETPQSVSVITDQRIQDQQLNDVTSVLQQAPGISVINGPGSSQFNPTYFSRGFAITSFQIDGGAPINFGGFDGNDGAPNNPFTPTFDLAQYDRVEVIRGSDGVNVGTGQPGGVISIHRKRPVEGTQILMTGLLGSYSKQRGTFDVSTPLFASDMFRLRVIGIHDNTNYFFNSAYRHKNSISANLEFDPFDSTQINVGVTYDNQYGLPSSGGLPRFTDGSSLGLPRSTCLCAPWNYSSAHGPTYFAELHQKFNQDWNATVNLNAIKQASFSNNADVFANGFPGGIAADGSGAFLQGTSNNASSTLAYSADAHLDGAVYILGHRQELTVGGSYSLNKYNPGTNAASYAFTDFPAPGAGGSIANLFAFNPNTIPLNPNDVSPLFTQTLSANQHQYAAYASARLSPWDPLHVLISERFTAYGNSSIQSVQFPGQAPFTFGTPLRSTVLPFPNFAVTYDIFPKTMTIYASRASIFTLSQDRAANGSYVAPETGATYEVGLKRSDFNGTLNSSIGFYLANQVNLPVQDPANGFGSPAFFAFPNCCFLSGGDKNTSKGIDFEISGAVTPEMQVQLSYTFNTNKFQPGPDNPFPLIAPLISQAPKNQVKLFATYQPASGILHNATFGISARYQDTTYAQGTTCSLANPRLCSNFNFTQSPYAIFDALLKYDINKNFNAQLNVTNILDRTYFATVGTPSGGNYYGQPRAFTLALNAKF